MPPLDKSALTVQAVSHQDYLCAKLREKLPGTARVIQIKRKNADICLPLNNCGEPTGVACFLVVVMHVSRSTARTLRRFPTHFFRGSGWTVQHFFPFPSQQRIVRHPKTQNNKRIILQVCHMQKDFSRVSPSSALKILGSAQSSWTVGV